MKYNQRVKTFVSRLNTNVKWTHSLESCLSDKLSIDIAFLLEYNSKVPNGSSRKNLDTLTRVSLTYVIK